jgi:sporulation protein YlmC with PRC-barrel domain
MKKTIVYTAMLLMSGLMAVPPAWSTTVERTEGQVTEDVGIKSGQLREESKNQPTTPTSTASISSEQGLRKNMLMVDNLIGADVQNQRGEKIGEIDKVLIDVPTGQVGYVLLSGGGMFGVGTDRYVVPFNALQVSSSDAFTLQMTRDQLMKAPAGDIETALNQDQGRQIHQYYGVSPYWEERSTIQRQDPHLQMEMRPESEQPTRRDY